jgi:hypothetical protein
MDTSDHRGPEGPVPEETNDGAVERLTRVLKQADLDCACRENLTRAIESFERFEAQRRERRSLEGAYRSRKEILGLLVFLEDFDQIMRPALDPQVCAEMAQVFDDIAEAARRGAAALRKLSGEART